MKRLISGQFEVGLSNFWRLWVLKLKELDNLIFYHHCLVKHFVNLEDILGAVAEERASSI
jgi:hypothetical protein